MIVCKTKKWGSSMGLLIPKEEADKLDLKVGEEIAVDITRKGNPLKELFGFGRNKKITRKEVEKTRKLLESKWVR